jgi:hypothetical protein
VCLIEAKASHSHKIWTEVSSSVTHFLQLGLLLNPITYKCLLKVLRPVGGPKTTLDCVLLKDNNRALVARLGPEISSWACLCVLQGPCHNTKCWLSIQHFIFLMFCLETPRKGSGPTNLRTEPSLVSLLAMSFPHIPPWVFQTSYHLYNLMPIPFIHFFCTWIILFHVMNVGTWSI